VNHAKEILIMNNVSSNNLRRHKKRRWYLRRRLKIARHKKRRENAYLVSLIKGITRLGINKRNAQNINYDIKNKTIRQLQLPKNLNFTKDYEETINHFTVIKNAIETDAKIKRIDFSNIKSMTTASALVLASLVDQWSERVKGKIKADLPTWDPSIIKLLRQMGYFELLNLKGPDVEEYDSMTTYIPFIKGMVGDKDAGKKALLLRQKIEEITNLEINRHYLFEGLSEAITNTCHHAYEGVTDEKRKYWWLTASYNKNNNELQITFFDRGIGIPKTLKSHNRFETIKEFFNSWTDSKKIEAAMEIGRTSSNLPERGKGLQNLIEFAKFYNKGKLRIISLRGSYEMVFSNEKDRECSEKEETKQNNYTGSIGGTLIQWSVIL